jgi:fumarate reductase iron-sulfur subunit
MILNIKRFNPELDKNEYINTFEVTEKNLLSALNEIKIKKDSTLTFRSGCKSGVCGSCAVNVNGVERLACKTTIEDNSIVEPIKNCKVIKDLVVDVSHETLLIDKAINTINNQDIIDKVNKDDVKKIDLQSNCILCNSCYSSCPVYSMNEKFLGPFALTRALRYVNDKKLLNKISIVESIQTNGIWDCTLCSACTLVCPQSIDPKADIMQLQNISVQFGFTNPYQQSFDLGFNDDFSGFNPNSF